MADELLNIQTEEPDEDRSLPIDLTRDFVIEKCEYFSSVGIWPLKSILDPGAWLSNFLPYEMDHAVYLLNAFIFFSNNLVNEVFASSLRTLSRLLMSQDDKYGNFSARWQTFIRSAIVTYVTGEIPSPTDSGYLFTRKARALGISQNMIKTPEEVCQYLRNGSVNPIIIVDDFMGSGQQFLATWYREYGSPSRSLNELAPVSAAPIYLCPAFCTEYALDQLRAESVKIEVNPGHFIPKSYGALEDNSIIWPASLRKTAVEFIQTASTRAGIPDTDGNTEDDWRGFAKLGLTIALEDSIPDATLPLFYWEQNGWRPLLRRTNA